MLRFFFCAEEMPYYLKMPILEEFPKTKTKNLYEIPT